MDTLLGNLQEYHTNNSAQFIPGFLFMKGT